MTEARPPKNHDGGVPEDKDGDDSNRTVENIVLAGFFVILVAAGVWLLGTMADVRKGQDCALQGRRNCQTIELPDRSR